MKKRLVPAVVLLLMVMAFAPFKKKVARVYLIGDSTVADYSDYDGEDYMNKRYPVMGWGQVFQPFLRADSVSKIKHIIKADSVILLDKARGGRSTRTFFEEGRWAAVYQELKKNDVVMIQFGHNDAAENKPERYVNVQGYKEYLRLYVNQTRQKGAYPILLTPVTRNYPWKDGKIGNVHGEYPQAVKDVARELNVPLIDLQQLSIDSFSAKGQEYVTEHYFMNLPAGKYKNYPDGQKDNTHFQPEGAKEVARLVFEGMKSLAKK
ncbi:rhamnogalacturonan acetylesterase [Rufibacter quisquiliarum]|uniref:Lysophospholipase L1-like esterase n=1 Tax=Rufibacter quisquiliarum TaxID=1549639 RepID=A0A839GN60_9BACT|nr:rhamnogalacturonan acetylesterase [Rufibacter quisquiliarum]MBA9076357.1 lysophospholipase L1-like esterase [Rufibacter quisquiliarum]